MKIWEGEWRRPQAVMWEANSQQTEVALYVRWLVKSERPDAAVALGTLVRQLQESLGLSLPGLARNRWIIATTDEGSTKPRVAYTSTRDRIGKTG